MSDLRMRASHFAIEAHLGQTRKYTGEPYVFHPLLVAMQVIQWGINDDEVIAAAILHDVVEDCGVSVDTLREKFGERVAELVWWLSDQSKPSDGNRATRKAIDRAHIERAPAAAQIIKCADLIDNTRTIVKHDPDFARVYLKEKASLLGVMTRIPEHARLDTFNALAKGEFALISLDLSKKENAGV